MKKSIFLSVVFSAVLLSGTVHAVSQEAPQGAAPVVVAPGQPAAPVHDAAPATAATAAAPQQPGGMLGMALPLVIMLGTIYFIMVRPQQKRLKEHQSLLSELKNGDEVITSAGILGTIAGMNDKVVTLEVSKNVQLKVLKSQVNHIIKGPIKDIQAPL